MEFLGNFWTTTHREDRYKEITSDHFDPSQDVSMVDFFLGRLSIARSLILPREESNIMSDLMRLFPGEIQRAWNAVPRTMRTKATQQFLIDMQATRDLEPCGRSVIRPKRAPGAPASQRREARDTQFPAPTVSPLMAFNPFSIPPPNVSGNADRTC